MADPKASDLRNVHNSVTDKRNTQSILTVGKTKDNQLPFTDSLQHVTIE